jgi:UDP-2,3-diacylglucosamine pyrophosphatase LpxH
LIIGLLLTAIGFAPEIIGNYVGPIEYKGFIVYDYPEGDNPINNIAITIDPTLADNLLIVNVPSPWSYTYGGGTLILSGGSLSPGGSVNVTVSLNRYFEDGEYPVNSIGTTTAGEMSPTSGPLLVGDLYLLNFIEMVSDLRFLIAGVVIGISFLELYLSRRKRTSLDTLQEGHTTEDNVYYEIGDVAPTGGDERIELNDDNGSAITTNEKKDKPISTQTREQESTKERSGDGNSDVITSEDDGDDPRDTPPPTIYGEEKDVDPFVPPVYIVSDFHIGSNQSWPGKVNKTHSNDMDKKTLEDFLEWLYMVNNDAAKYDHYDVVMNGDFLDLWQATRPNDDNYQKRLEDILETNQVWDHKAKGELNFFSKLGGFIKNSPRCRFYYVIGNHDDALYSGNHRGDPNYGEGNSFNSLRNMVTGKLRDGDNSLISFAMNRQYTNANYKLYVEHGHQHDATNMKKENGGPSGGQQIAHQINHLQEIDPLFRNIEKTPNQETAKYLKCLVNNPSTPEKLKNEIDKLKEISIDAEAYIKGNIVDFLLTDEGMSNAIIDRIDPKKINRNELEEAHKIIDDNKRIPQRKIVVFGHTHIHDLQPSQLYSQWAYANSGTWLDDIIFDSTQGCQLKSSPSNLPYVKISKEKGEDIALVELKFFKGRQKDRLIKVRLT